MPASAIPRVALHRVDALQSAGAPLGRRAQQRLEARSQLRRVDAALENRRRSPPRALIASRLRGGLAALDEARILEQPQDAARRHLVEARHARDLGDGQREHVVSMAQERRPRRADALLRGTASIEEELVDEAILLAVNEHAPRRLAVASRAPGLLVVGLDAPGQR